MYSIEAMEFEIVVEDFRVRADMYSPEDEMLSSAVVESWKRKPTNFAIRKAMRTAYRKYTTQEDLELRSGIYTYRDGLDNDPDTP